MIEIVPLSQIAPARIEALLDDAFGTDRHTRTAYMLREGVEAVPALSFAAIDGDRLAGTLQSWPVALRCDDGTCVPMTLVGPVAVDPGLQRGGIGRILMAKLIDAAEAHAHNALMMIGDPEYYGRFFNFTADATGGWILPGPVERHRLLALIGRLGGVPAHGHVIPDPAFATARITA